MLNEKIAVTVKTFQGNADKNGMEPVYLNVLAGKCPNRNVLSGTIAEREGLEVGKSYLMQVREIEANEYGRQFTFSKIGELSALDVLDIEARLSSPVIIDVSIDEDVDTDTGEIKEKAEKPAEYSS